MLTNRSTQLEIRRARSGVRVLCFVLLTLVVSAAAFTACSTQSTESETVQSSFTKSPAPTFTAMVSSTPTLTPAAINSAGLTATTEEEEAQLSATVAAELAAATSQAEASSTAAQLELISVDYNAQATATEQAQKIDKLISVQADAVFAGPMAGYLKAEAGKKPAPGSADINLRNFVARTRFAFRSPGDSLSDRSADDSRPAGFTLQFRSGSDGFTALVIYQDGSWELAIFDGQAMTGKQEGQLNDLKPEDWNDLVLYVDEVRGFFSLNGRLVSQLALEETLHAGDIAIAMGKPTTTDPVGAAIDYTDFTVWAMEPILPTPTPTPSLTPYPTITPATRMPPEGMGQITLINETEDRPLSVDLPDCPGYIGSVAPGQRIECRIPEGSYSWRAWGWGCQSWLPHLNLVRGTFVSLRIIRADGDCDYSLSLCIGDECLQRYPVRIE